MKWPDVECHSAQLVQRNFTQPTCGVEATDEVYDVYYLLCMYARERAEQVGDGVQAIGFILIDILVSPAPHSKLSSRLWRHLATKLTFDTV